MTRAQLKRAVKRALAANRRAGWYPQSLYEYAQQLGIRNEQFSMVLNGKKTSTRIHGLLEGLVRSAAGPEVKTAMAPTAEEIERCVVAKEAAALLGLAPKTLYNRLSHGGWPELRAFKLNGRWRVPVSSIKALLAPAQGAA